MRFRLSYNTPKKILKQKKSPPFIAEGFVNLDLYDQTKSLGF